MDYAAVTDAQQQHQQQQQYQQQYQQQDPQQQAYDPTQAQAYEAYYAYQQQQYDASAYQQQQYYPHDYSSAAAYQPSQPAAQPDPGPATAPAPQTQSHATAAQDSAQIHAPQHHQHHSGASGASSSVAAAPGHGYPPQEQQGPSYPMPHGLNPAAAAAERAMAERQWHGKGGGMMGPGAGGPQQLPHHHQYPQHHLHPHPMQHGPVSIRPGGGGRNPYRGGGRRGGGPFRGGGSSRGNFGGASPPFRGRGRGRMGRGRGRRFEPQPYTAPALPVDSSSVPELMRAPARLAAVSNPVLPRRPLLPIAWCDICRVDCNSLEILEQHKNGKRHKKTVQRYEEIQAKQKLIAELQAQVGGKPEMAFQGAEPNQAFQVGEVSNASGQVNEANKASVSSENIPEVISEQNKQAEVQAAEQNMESGTAQGQPQPLKVEMGTEAPTTELPSSDAPVTEGSLMVGTTWGSRMSGYDRFDRRRGGTKRKMVRIGRGGKRLRSLEPVRGRVPERPREQPRVCTLCNVMCDTLAVFECHLSGKKHISKIKRFQAQDSVFGPITVYIPPNQPSTYPTQGLEPLFYGLKSHEMLQQEAYGLNGPQVENYGLQQSEDQGKQARNAEGGAAIESQVMEILEHPVGEEILVTEGWLNGPQVENYGLQQSADQGEQARNAEGGAAIESQVMEILEHPEGEEVPVTEGQEAVTLDLDSQNAVEHFEAVVEPSPLPTISAPESGILETEVAVAVAEDVMPLPDCGASIGDKIALPGLDGKVEEPGPNTEEFGGGTDIALQ